MWESEFSPNVPGKGGQGQFFAYRREGEVNKYTAHHLLYEVGYAHFTAITSAELLTNHKFTKQATGCHM